MNKLMNIRQTAAKALLWALLVLVCADIFAFPAHAQTADDADGFSMTITGADGQPREGTFALELAKEDLHNFVLTAKDPYSTGYCKVEATDTQGTVSTWYITPISGSRTVNLILRAAEGTEITFAAGQGAIPPGARTVAPGVSLYLEAPLSVFLNISGTPYVTYTVPERTSLPLLAKYYGVTEESILVYNGIENISEGKTIRIPGVAPENAPESYVPVKRHIVAAGETLSSIAAQYGISLEILRKMNNLTTSSTLGVGQELVIYDIHILEENDWEPTPYEWEEDQNTDKQILEIPLYYQQDYPDVRYGEGTVATSGCSITSLAMVATALTGHEYLPDELAEYFCGVAESNMGRLEYGSEKLQLPYRKSDNWHETWNALTEGKIVIALMGGNSLFTNTQHFIVLTGLNDEGRIMVNDCNLYNYDNWQLKKAFEEGFEKGDILQGYSGGWIYDPSAMPEEPYIYSEPRLDRSVNNYPDIQLTEEEEELLAKLIWVEARGESQKGQQAVAEVVLNRLQSSQFSDNLYDVIHGQGQFRSVPYLEDATPWAAQYQAIDRAIHGTRILPENVVYFATFATNDRIWGTIGGHIFCYE